MRNSLVAINILNNSHLINDRGVPFLFYWDGETDLDNALLSSEELKDYLYEKVINKDNYTSTRLAMFYFKYDADNNEVYSEKQWDLQSFLKLPDIKEDKQMFYKEYLWEHFQFLYDSAYHESYDKTVSLFDIDDAILDVYDKIQEKYPKRVIKSTVVNYIRGELQNNNNLSMENTNWIILQLEKLLTERE